MGNKPKHLRTQVNRSKQGAGAGGILMLGVLVVVLVGGILFIDSLTGFIGVVPQAGFGPDTAGGVYVGSVTPSLSHRDSIQPTTTYNEGAHITTTFYTANDVSTGNTSWIAEAADGGVVDMEVVGSVGATLLLDIGESLKTTYVTGYSYVDFDGDANDEHLFTLDFRGLPARAAGQTSQDLPISIVWYNHQMPTGAVNDPSAFVVNVGGAQNNTQVYRYRFTWANFDRAALLRNIEIVFNSTATNKYTLDQIDVPFRGQTISFKGSDMEEIIGTNATYRKVFASGRGDQSNYFIITKTGGVLYNDVIVHVTWTMAATDKLVMRVNMNFWDDDEIQQKAQAEVVSHHTGPLA